MEPLAPLLIAARSKREAMDWGLVLISQGIQSTVTHIEDRWGLLVEEGDFERASSILNQWQAENRGWRWRRKLPGSELHFHWGSLLWAISIAAFYYKTLSPSVKAVGVMDGRAVMNGQWWRLFTAVTLHADLPHLISNATMGSLLFGLAMARFGSGVALLAGFLAGAAGNAIGLAFYTENHQGLGSSGMVMGALGLLAVQSIDFWRQFRPSTDVILRGLAAGVLILVLMGFSPETDVLAHVGGFLGGAILGFGLSWVRPQLLHTNTVNAFSLLVLLGLVGLTWWLALNTH